MNKMSLKKGLAYSVLLISVGYVGSASAAQTCLNNQTLLASAGVPTGQDLYRVSCPAGTTQLEAYVNLQSGSQVQLQIGREGYGSANVTGDSPLRTDTTTGGTYSAAPACTLSSGSSSAQALSTVTPAGAKEYNIMVNTINTTASTYGMRVNCIGGATTTLLTPAPVINR